MPSTLTLIEPDDTVHHAEVSAEVAADPDARYAALRGALADVPPTDYDDYWAPDRPLPRLPPATRLEIDGKDKGWAPGPLIVGERFREDEGYLVHKCDAEGEPSAIVAVYDTYPNRRSAERHTGEGRALVERVRDGTRFRYPERAPPVRGLVGDELTFREGSDRYTVRHTAREQVRIERDARTLFEGSVHDLIVPGPRVADTVAAALDTALDALSAERIADAARYVLGGPRPAWLRRGRPNP